MTLELFRGRNSSILKDVPMITLTSTGIYFNRKCYEEFLKGYGFIDVYLDREKRQIGFLPIKKPEIHSYRLNNVGENTKSKRIHGKSIFEALDIKLGKGELLKLTPKLNSGGILLIKIDGEQKPKKKRGRKPKLKDEGGYFGRADDAKVLFRKSPIETAPEEIEATEKAIDEIRLTDEEKRYLKHIVFRENLITGRDVQKKKIIFMLRFGLEPAAAIIARKKMGFPDGEAQALREKPLGGMEIANYYDISPARPSQVIHEILNDISGKLEPKVLEKLKTLARKKK